MTMFVTRFNVLDSEINYQKKLFSVDTVKRINHSADMIKNIQEFEIESLKDQMENFSSKKELSILESKLENFPTRQMVADLREDL